MLYALSAFAVSVGAALLAGHVPGILLGLLVAASLALVGWGLVRVERRRFRVGRRTRDVMPCYLSVQDSQLRILEVNVPFRRNFGPGIGEFCYVVYKKRDTPCPDCPVLKTFEDGEEHVSEETFITEGGETRKVVVTSMPLADEQGMIHEVMEMSTNVTEVKALREEIRRSKEHFRNLFDIVPCYITIQDRNFRIIESNALYRRDFAEIERRRCFRAYKRRTSVCADCPVEKTFADGKIHTSEETVITRDGREAEVVVYSMPVHDEGGEITAVMEVSTNISEVKQLQRQLAMIGLAVAGMAHRIKNVLMGLEGGIFVVDTGFEDGDQEAIRTGWEMVQRNVAKVSRVAQDLLFCSKERISRFTPGVSPRALATEVYQLYCPRAEQEDIELSLQVGQEDDRGVFDPAAIQSLVTNLVSNALDACRFDFSSETKHYRIAIRCELDDAGDVVIEVSDNGAGIPQEATARVFHSFFSSKGSEGTGLGLFVSQKVVEEHGGSINFESEEGEGTTFRVVLSRFRATSDQPGEQTTPPRPT